MKKTNKGVLWLAAMGMTAIVHAESAPAPTLATGDTWTYVDTVETGPNGWRQTHDEIVVTHITSDRIYYEAKQAGTTQASREMIAGIDWSRSRNVNGTETLVNQPLSFPLTTGKSWNVKYTEAHPNPKHDSESLDERFKVVGIENIEVPAGKFDAIKVEAEGDWTAQTAPVRSATGGTVVTETGAAAVAQTRKVPSVTTTGRLYKAFWYVPEIGRWVKSVEEYYSSNGVRNERVTSELESFKHGSSQ
ncbi:hypothetical protein [Pararobbsia silviterrae]|uniref:DUF3108 domain-containing protein n=1 Tax=Pararobbsia silviterrae TaxID=1792498 RepID=A0A494YAV2_9BURK|nr:hypothetical protein [Pararobbsia silviterrae]RKP59295.1 hypothetical protein D7S86_05280 [Pararobbsia silviterrae]